MRSSQHEASRLAAGRSSPARRSRAAAPPSPPPTRRLSMNGREEQLGLVRDLEALAVGDGNRARGVGAVRRRRSGGRRRPSRTHEARVADRPRRPRRPSGARTAGPVAAFLRGTACRRCRGRPGTSARRPWTIGCGRSGRPDRALDAPGGAVVLLHALGVEHQVDARLRDGERARRDRPGLARRRGIRGDAGRGRRRFSGGRGGVRLVALAPGDEGQCANRDGESSEGSPHGLGAQQAPHLPSRFAGAQAVRAPIRSAARPCREP